MLISIIIPCFNEEAVIHETVRRLKNFIDSTQIDAELIFVDDGSKDNSREILKTYAKTDVRIKIIGFSRNFGHQLAVTAGMDIASGDAIILMDADLQDPPELISNMLEKWQEGYQVVYMQRKTRLGESHFKLATAHAFYKILNILSDVPIPLDVGDFRLMDRILVDAIKSMPERDRFIRGMVSWVGFKQIGIEYTRAARYAGESKYPLVKMLKFAMTGILSFSAKPMQPSMLFGCIVASLAFIGIIWAFIQRICTNNWVDGWTSLFLAILFIGGIQLVCIGILGEYIGRIYTQVKNRPMYIIDYKVKYLLCGVTCLLLMSMEAPIRAILLLIPLICSSYYFFGRKASKIFLILFVSLSIGTILNRFLLADYPIIKDHFHSTDIANFTNFMRNLSKLSIEFIDSNSMVSFQSKAKPIYLFCTGCAYLYSLLIVGVAIKYCIEFLKNFYSYYSRSFIKIKEYANEIAKYPYLSNSIINFFALTGGLGILTGLIIVSLLNPDTPRHFLWAHFVLKLSLILFLVEFTQKSINPKTFCIAFLILTISSSYWSGMLIRHKLKIRNESVKRIYTDVVYDIRKVANDTRIKKIYGVDFWRMMPLNTLIPNMECAVLHENGNISYWLTRKSWSNQSGNVLYYTKGEARDKVIISLLKKVKAKALLVKPHGTIWLAPPIWNNEYPNQ